MNTISYPTQGEVLRFAYDVFSVLPRKNDDDSVFDETQKKSLQTVLRRLAAEEGELEANFADMVQKLAYLVAGTIPERVALALGDSLFDLFDIYQSTLRDEGTFLNKTDTVKWLMLDRLALRIPISVAKHKQAYEVDAYGLVAPAEAYWYLPEKHAGDWVWPLERTMRWAYALAGTSIQRFYRPGNGEWPAQKNNHDNAKNWLAGRSIPSWPALLSNFNQAFEARGSRDDDVDSPRLSPAEENSIRIMLFIARTTTDLSKRVLDSYGELVLLEVISRYKVMANAIAIDVHEINAITAQLCSEQQIPAAERNAAQRHIFTQYLRRGGDAAQEILAALDARRLTRIQALEHARKFGAFAALPIEKAEIFTSTHAVPEGFGAAIHQGMALRQSDALTLADIDTYATSLDDKALQDILAWMAPWQRATYYYRAKRYAEAFPHIAQAFEAARYCA